MFMTMDLTLSLDAELANLLADFDAFLAAEDTLFADDGFEDDGFEDDGLEDEGFDDGVDDSGDDELTDETGEDPTVGEDAIAEDPPVDGEPVDQGGVDDSGDPADVSEEVEPDLGPQVDFGLVSDELAFDLSEALMVGRKLGGEFLDFA